MDTFQVTLVAGAAVSFGFGYWRGRRDEKAKAIQAMYNMGQMMSNAMNDLARGCKHILMNKLKIGELEALTAMMEAAGPNGFLGGNARIVNVKTGEQVDVNKTEQK